VPVEFTRRIVKQYLKLHAAIQRKVDKAMLLLDADFRKPGLRSHPVEGTLSIWGEGTCIPNLPG